MKFILALILFITLEAQSITDEKLASCINNKRCDD